MKSITFTVHPLVLAAIVAVAVPTVAIAAGTILTPPVSVTGSSSGSLLVSTNSGSGAAIQGTSTSGRGVLGQTKSKTATSLDNGQAGVTGQDQSTIAFNAGVRGFSNKGLGVYGISTINTGVEGISTSGAGVAGVSSQNNGVLGTTAYSGSTNGLFAGVLGEDLTSTQQYGVEGTSTDGVGVQGKSQDLFGTSGISTEGLGIQGISTSGIAVSAENSSSSLPALYAQTTGVGPEMIANNGSFDVMSLDSSGNMILYGSLTEFSTPLVVTRVSSGENIGTYSATEAQPTVEDVGEAQLRGGSAFVSLDPAFVKTIDQTKPYLVFITPQGDSRGLYAGQKSLSGFFVRENGAGRSTLIFDYRIVAKPYHSGPRLPILSQPLLGTTQRFGALRVQHAIVEGLLRTPFHQTPQPR